MQNLQRVTMQCAKMTSNKDRTPGVTQ
jgi:hypothetical protein